MRQIIAIRKGFDMENVKKPIPHWSRVGWSIAGASALIILVCFSVGIAVGKSPNANEILPVCLIFGSLSFAGVITGIAIVIGKRYEARVIEDLHSGKDVLVHWTYTPEEWNKFVGGEISQRNKIAPLIFILILVPTALMLIWAGALDAATLFVLAITALIIRAVVYLPGRTLQKSGRGDVFVSPASVLMGNRRFGWTSFGARLTGAHYIAGNPPVVAFEWIQSGAGLKGLPAPKIVRVPVPEGSEAAARQLISALKS